MYYETLRKAIKESGITQSRLALKVEIMPCNFARALSGKVEFYPGYQKRVSEFLGIDVAELFPIEEIPEMWRKKKKGV
jgi:transcriptional regulator with XRE-family HTH domain